VVRVLEKRLGALPVVAQFGRRLRIAEVVDELRPSGRWRRLDPLHFRGQ
jgi:hypothetical protein